MAPRLFQCGAQPRYSLFVHPTDAAFLQQQPLQPVGLTGIGASVVYLSGAAEGQR